MQEAIVPLISSSTVGPLGVMHLPRLWYKLLLHAKGKLPEGYRCGSGGFDEKLCDELGVPREAFIAYVEGELPDYPAVEAWVIANAKNLNDASIASFNTYVVERVLPPDMLAQRRTELQLTDMSLVHGVVLNNLDDWSAAHRALVNG
jgi:hypothetical protein